MFNAFVIFTLGIKYKYNIKLPINFDRFSIMSFSANEVIKIRLNEGKCKCSLEANNYLYLTILMQIDVNYISYLRLKI